MLPLHMTIIRCMLQSLLGHSGRQLIKKIYKTLVGIVMRHISYWRCIQMFDTSLVPIFQLTMAQETCWNMHDITIIICTGNICKMTKHTFCWTHNRCNKLGINIFPDISIQIFYTNCRSGACWKNTTMVGIWDCYNNHYKDTVFWSVMFRSQTAGSTKTLIYIQGVSRFVDITTGGDFLGLCDQKSSYKHVSDFGRLWSYGHF